MGKTEEIAIFLNLPLGILLGYNSIFNSFSSWFILGSIIILFESISFLEDSSFFVGIIGFIGSIFLKSSMPSLGFYLFWDSIKIYKINLILKMLDDKKQKL